MKTTKHKPTRTPKRPIAIQCLSCGAHRNTNGTHSADTGECPRCGYLGWTYTNKLDATTAKMIVNRKLARRPARSGDRERARPNVLIRVAR